MSFKYPLQVIVSRLGAPASSAAKRLLGKRYGQTMRNPELTYGNNGALLLALRRCVPFASTTETLLELMEADGQTPMAPIIGLTLKSGGLVRHEIANALSKPERGLVLPAVRYLTMNPDPYSLMHCSMFIGILTWFGRRY